jgi:TolA-binding protein
MIYRKNFPAGDKDGAMCFMTGESLRIMGNIEEAKNYFNEVIGKGETSEYNKSGAYLGLSRCFGAEGKYDEAEQMLEKALGYSDNNTVGAYARIELGNLKERKGEHEEAAKLYLMVAVLYDDKGLCSGALFHAAECYGKAGMPEKAIEIYNDLAKRYPDSPFAQKAVDKIGQASTLGNVKTGE